MIQTYLHDPAPASPLPLARKHRPFAVPGATTDVEKSPGILELLRQADHDAYRKSDLESAIVSQLPQFLLELGWGSALLACQKSIIFDEHHQLSLPLHRRSRPTQSRPGNVLMVGASGGELQ